MKRTGIFFLQAFLAALLVPSLEAQDDPITEEKYKNGLLPTGTYDGA